MTYQPDVVFVNDVYLCSGCGKEEIVFLEYVMSK